MRKKAYTRADITWAMTGGDSMNHSSKTMLQKCSLTSSTLATLDISGENQLRGFKDIPFLVQKPTYCYGCTAWLCVIFQTAAKNDFQKEQSIES